MKKKIMYFVVTLILAIGVFFMPINNVQAATVYKGIDIYEYDNISNYQQLKNNNTNIVIEKATQGLYHNDSMLYTRYDQLVANNFHIGFYHFADNSGDPVGEAKHFLSQVNGLWHDTVYWLDIEDESAWTQAQAIDYVNKFVSYVQLQNCQIGLYTSMSMYYEYLHGNIDPSIPIWLASYGNQPQQYPNVVSWQYSESGNIPGIVGNVDLDYFNENIFGNGSSYIKSVQHDLQRVSCLASGESNANGILDLKTKLGIQEFRDIENLPSGTNIDSNLIDALNAITHKDTTGQGWNNNVYVVRFLQWYLGVSRTGIYDTNMTNIVKTWQIKSGIWSASGADGVIREKDFNKILK